MAQAQTDSPHLSNLCSVRDWQITPEAQHIVPDVFSMVHVTGCLSEYYTIQF